MSALREGFTTGSCAAACALASCLWQRDGDCPSQVALTVPEGRTYMAEIHAIGPYRCAVYKDSGDDPDITNGSEVWAQVQLLPEGPVRFQAGEGVGTVTLPGLKVAVGEPAINPVPRCMIEDAVRSVFPEKGALVTVGVTGGRELAQRTFNPRLGIVDGLSILGTTGVVRPMSEEALTDTIRLELTLRKANGADVIALVFGSQGEIAGAEGRGQFRAYRVGGSGAAAVPVFDLFRLDPEDLADGLRGELVVKRRPLGRASGVIC